MSKAIFQRPVQLSLGRVVTILLLVAIYVGAVVFFASANERFLSWSNGQSILRHMSASGLAALGLTFVIIVRQYDLSFPWVASFGGMTTGFLIAQGFPIAAAIVGGLAASLVFGAINGIAVGLMRLPDIITSIATGSIAFGLAYLYSNGVSIYDNFLTSGILSLNDARIAGVPLPPVLFLGIALACWVLLERTRFGRAFHATGENRTSAYYSGIRVRSYVVASFCICALLATLAAILVSAGGGQADVRMGANLMMPAYASVFLGTAVFGRTGIPATVAGTLFMSTLLNGFNVMGVPFYYGDAIVSGVLILALSIANPVIHAHVRAMSDLLRSRDSRGV